MPKLIAWLVEGQLYCPDCCTPSQGEVEDGHASARYEGDGESDESACCGTCNHTIACCARLGALDAFCPACDL